MVLASLLGLATGVSAGQADSPHDAPGDQADKAVDQHSGKKKANPKTRDLDSCRRDARGLEGPERSRFMTECLRTRE